MICSVVMTLQKFAILIAALSAACTVMVLDVQTLVFGDTAIVEDIWTTNDLAKLATLDKMAAAVSRLTDAYRPGAPMLWIEKITKSIDAATERDIREALFTVADGKDDREEAGNLDRKTDPLYTFAKTVNNDATCETWNSAGRYGLGVCVARCERKSFLAREPKKGACYMLCSLAIAPCTNGIVAVTFVDLEYTCEIPCVSALAYCIEVITYVPALACDTDSSGQAGQRFRS